MHPWHNHPIGNDAPDRINVIVEIPKGSRNKYELDKDTGFFHLSRVLYSPMIYPGDYGFIPQTYYEDDDPLDVLILTNEPTFTSCVVEARPVGIFKMLDKGQPDDKILAVPCHSPYFGHMNDLKDIPPHFLKEVAHFFAVYKDLEGSRTLSLGWEDVKVAKRQIMHAIDLYRETFRDTYAKKESLATPKGRGARIIPVSANTTPRKKAIKTVTRKSATRPAAKNSKPGKRKS